MIKQRVYSKYALDAAFLIGQRIKLARKSKKWSSANLAEIAELQKHFKELKMVIWEHGLVLFFESPAIIGVPLYKDKQLFSNNLELIQSKIKLYHKIRTQKKVVMTTLNRNYKEAYVWIWLPGKTKPVVAGKLEVMREYIIFNYGKSYLEKEVISIYEPKLTTTIRNTTTT